MYPTSFFDMGLKLDGVRLTSTRSPWVSQGAESAIQSLLSDRVG